MKNEFENWPFVLASIQENSEEISMVGLHTVRLPVWAFLSCRTNIGYVLQQRNIQYSMDDDTKKILANAMIHANDYEVTNQLKPLPEDELVEILSRKGFTRNLTVHQKRNLSKLCALNSGATFSVPGAGKTTEALAFYYFKKHVGDKLLVVCPKNAFAAWEEQTTLCLDSSRRVGRLVGGVKEINKILKGDYEIYLITYQQLPNVKTLVANYMLEHPMFMFLDESHRIKRGFEGQWCNAVLDLSHLPIGKLLMSGTPLPNSVDDLIPQFKFIFPEVIADSNNIKEKIQPIFVRTTKQELNLPQMNQVYIPVALRPKQRELYELLRNEEARQLSRLQPRDKNSIRRIGKSVLRLLQLVSNPALLAKESIGWPEDLFSVLQEGDSPKIEYACFRARHLAKQGLKTLIWSNFVENVELISSRLVDLGADFIHGGVEAGSEEEENTREKKLKRFHADPDAFVLVANPAACAEGISLHTVCHHAIYVDRNYNAAQFLQSQDRIHRLGLPSNIITTVEVLYSPDTVDESVKRRLERKVSKMAEILDDHSIGAFELDLESEGLDSEDIQDFLATLNQR